MLGGLIDNKLSLFSDIHTFFKNKNNLNSLDEILIMPHNGKDENIQSQWL